MPVSPWHVGQTAPYFTLTPLQDNYPQTRPNDLPASASAYTFVMQDQATGTVTNGTGTFDTSDIANGNLIYQPSAADVATAGVFKFWVRYTNASNKVNESDAVDWIITNP